MTPPFFYRFGGHFTHCHCVTLNTAHQTLWCREDPDAEALALARTIVKAEIARGLAWALLEGGETQLREGLTKGCG